LWDGLGTPCGGPGCRRSPGQDFIYGGALSRVVQPPLSPPLSPVGWRPPAPRSSAVIVAVVLLVILVAVVVVVAVVAGWWQSSGGFFPLWNVLAPLCIVGVIVIVFLVATVAGAFQSRPNLPPPPPVQQPMVPAGLQGTAVSLNCPNCGAPPENIDRFGVAMCTHCGTRFLVR